MIRLFRQYVSPWKVIFVMGEGILIFLAIAFTAFLSGNLDIWIARLNGDSLRQLTSDPATDHHPQWSPDGTFIVFSSDRSGNWDVWTINADGTGENRLDMPL